MRQLLGPQTPGSQDPILRELFLQKLPQGKRMVLAAAEDMPLDRLAMLADRTAEYASPSIATITPQEPPAWETALTRLEARIEARMEQLSCAVAAVRPSHETPSRRTRRDLKPVHPHDAPHGQPTDRSAGTTGGMQNVPRAAIYPAPGRETPRPVTNSGK